MDVDQRRILRLTNYVMDLQRRNREELGFLPAMAIREYAARSQILPAGTNHDWYGYLLFYDGRNGNLPRKHPTTLKIHQVCIQYDVRRVLHATRLVDTIVQRAHDRGMTHVQAWVATDIDANAFWKALGFRIIDTRQGGRKRNRLHHLWSLKIPAVRNVHCTELGRSLHCPPGSLPRCYACGAVSFPAVAACISPPASQ